MSEKNYPIGVMFICMGNICRSPMAEAVFQYFVDKVSLTEHFNIASSAVGQWHIGERPHPGTQEILKQNHIPLNPQKRAMLFEQAHIIRYEYILALDLEIARNIQSMFGLRIKRLMEFEGGSRLLDIPDPYYDHKFKTVYDLVLTGCEGLLKNIRKEKGI